MNAGGRNGARLYVLSPSGGPSAPGRRFKKENVGPLSAPLRPHIPTPRVCFKVLPLAKIGSRDCNLIVNRLQSRGMKREIGALASTALLLHWSATREVLSREQSRRPGRDAPRTGMMVCDGMYARKMANEKRSSTPISLKMSLVHRAHGSGST